MGRLEMLLMTGMNFAGGSEFATVNLWAEPLPILLIATITFMINSRHILMGAALAPHLKGIPLKKAAPALFLCVMKAGPWHSPKSKTESSRFACIQYAFLYGRMLYPLHYLIGFAALGAAVGPVFGNVWPLEGSVWRFLPYFWFY